MKKAPKDFRALFSIQMLDVYLDSLGESEQHAIA
jgi:hypothetical protein